MIFAPHTATQQFFEHLVGGWVVARRISHFGAFAGAAHYTPRTDGTLAYHEHGALTSDAGAQFEAHKRLYLALRDGEISVFFDEDMLQPFHSFVLAPAPSNAPDAAQDNAAFIGFAQHLCGADTYDTRYSVHSRQQHAIVHTVRGPKKCFEILSHFRRA